MFNLPDFYLLFSHELTEAQKEEAYAKLNVRNIYYLPEDLKALWSQIPPELEKISAYIQPIKDWLEKQVKEGDYILIQGDFGATYEMIRWALAKKLKPLYATTKRVVVETREEGKVITHRLFEHVRFRFYQED